MKRVFTLLIICLTTAAVFAQAQDETLTVTGQNSVVVGGRFGPYTTEITYSLCTYTEDDVTKMDVEVPGYQLAGTAIGDLTVGGYTVKGLCFDDEKGGFYRDYAEDGLTMSFSAVNAGVVTFDGVYGLYAPGCESILVERIDGKTRITNTFRAGDMPFPIVAVFEEADAAGISAPVFNTTSAMRYSISGQRVTAAHRGIVIRDGRKQFVR